MLEIVILAAGKGTRMHSNKPKVLHTLAGKPFVGHVIDRSVELNAAKIHLVVGHGAKQVEEALQNSAINFVLQAEQLGTGHAVQQVVPHLTSNSKVLILYGDVPLIKKATLERLLALVSNDTIGLLTVSLDNPSGYGRIVRNANGEVTEIVEQKDANEEQLIIKEVNTGVMALTMEQLAAWLPKLSNNNAQGEYYLTDLISLACEHNVRVLTDHPEEESEVMGVNNRRQQAELERIFQGKIAEALLDAGVTLTDPSRFDCRGEIVVGEDCVIDINCIFEGTVSLGNNVSVGANCILKNCSIAENTVILPNTIIEDSTIGKGCNIGPFARIRPGSVFSENVKIGNFVETKKACIGVASKVNHLSYIGDAEVGAGVNIGAGTITCNYDGANKFSTVIGDGVFVGSNTALVAPIVLAADTTVAAGSTVTRDAEKGQLIVARTRQRNIDNWKRPTKG